MQRRVWMWALFTGLLVLLAGAWGLSRAGAARPPAPLPPALFTDVTTATIPGLPQVAYSSLAWGDYDNDGRADVFLTGCTDLTTNCPNRASRLYHNLGSVFSDTSALIPALPQVGVSAVAWGDYDNDGRLDLLLTGQTVSGSVTALYHNTGSGFVDVSNLIQNLLQVQVAYGSVAWGDYDNDGRLDFLLTGQGAGGGVSRLYRNTGGGFVDASAAVPGLPQVAHSSVAWGDYDGDGWLDFLITGQTPSGLAGRLYRNTGGAFIDASAVVPGLPQVAYSSVAWGDYDADGRLDFLLTGADGVGSPVSRLYRNTGSGFVDASAFVQGGLPAVQEGSVAWADYDNDGRLDFLLAGCPTSACTSPLSLLYQNTGTAFVDATPAGLPQVAASSLAWGDYNGDGRRDFLLSGRDATQTVTRLYRNSGSFPSNTAPGAPGNLQVSGLTAVSATLSWSAASDPQTPAGGLSYNLRIGTRPGGGDVVGPMAHLAGGTRRLPALGPIQALARTVTGLTPDRTYYWSVQAIDSAFAGGAFAAEGSFHTPPAVLGSRQPEPIATGPGDQQAPRTAGNLVVWEDSIDGTWDVYAKDLATGRVFPVAVGPGDQRHPTISGDLVAWQDSTGGGPWVIQGARVASDTVVARFSVATGPTDQVNPTADGNVVVWQKAAATTTPAPIPRYDIMARDVTTTGLPLTLNPAGTTNVNPAISGRYVVWQSIVPTTTLESPAGVGRWDVLGYDLSAGTPLTVSTAPGDKINPAISGQTVVWQTIESAAGQVPAGVGRWTVEGSNIDGSNPFTVTTTTDEQINPAISGRMVVVQDRAFVPGAQVPFPFTSWRVIAVNPDTGDSQTLSNTPGDATMPAAGGSTVVWQQPGADGTQEVWGLCGVYLDVHDGDYFAAPVSYLSCRGAINGYADSTFRPFNNTTRAQVAKIVVLGFAIPLVTPPAGAHTFADVPPGFPFFDVIETAAAHNLVSGYTCGGPGEPCDPQGRPYFRPYNNVTRGQLSKIDVVAAGWTPVNPPAATFADVLPGSAFYTFIEAAYCHAIISGYGCGGPGEPCDPQNRPYFRQNADATRGQIAKIVYLSIVAGATCPAPP